MNRKSLSSEPKPGTVMTHVARKRREKLIAEADRIRAITLGPLEDCVSILREYRDRR